MQKQSTEEQFKAAKPAFDIIDEQIFDQQYNSETSKQLDKLFLSVVMDPHIECDDRIQFCQMYFNLKKLLKTIKTAVEPKSIESIEMDISMYFSS